MQNPCPFIEWHFSKYVLNVLKKTADLCLQRFVLPCKQAALTVGRKGGNSELTTVAVVQDLERRKWDVVIAFSKENLQYLAHWSDFDSSGIRSTYNISSNRNFDSPLDSDFLHGIDFCIAKLLDYGPSVFEFWQQQSVVLYEYTEGGWKSIMIFRNPGNGSTVLTLQWI